MIFLPNSLNLASRIFLDERWNDETMKNDNKLVKEIEIQTLDSKDLWLTFTQMFCCKTFALHHLWTLYFLIWNSSVTWVTFSIKVDCPYLFQIGILHSFVFKNGRFYLQQLWRFAEKEQSWTALLAMSHEINYLRWLSKGFRVSLIFIFPNFIRN